MKRARVDPAALDWHPTTRSPDLWVVSASDLVDAIAGGGQAFLILAQRGDCELAGVATGVLHQVAFAPFTAGDLEARAQWLQAEVASAHGRKLALNEARLSTAGRVAAYVAHETRNALSYAWANARYVRDALSTHRSPNPDVVDAAVDAEEGLARSLEASRTILDLCRGEALEASPFDLNEVTRSTVDFLTGRGRERVQFDLQLAEVPKALGHASGVKQVLTNLVLNAMDAAGPTGQVQIRTERQGDRLSLSVADSGSGLKASSRRSLFQPFHSTKAANGSGIGLTVSRSIVDSLGGSIEVVPRGPLGGAEFRVFLPTACQA